MACMGPEYKGRPPPEDVTVALQTILSGESGVLSVQRLVADTSGNVSTLTVLWVT